MFKHLHTLGNAFTTGTIVIGALVVGAAAVSVVLDFLQMGEWL